MNLKPLYEIQDGLRAHIDYKGEDKNEKMLLAFISELGECANEWRGFKYWSKDQKPRTVKRVVTEWDNGTPTEWNEYPNVNPLLEEYVDGLHYVLEMGLDYEIPMYHVMTYLKEENITWQFIRIVNKVMDVSILKNPYYYLELIQLYLGLGEMLGFTEQKIIDAYMEKNKVNHERQNNGY